MDIMKQLESLVNLFKGTSDTTTDLLELLKTQGSINELVTQKDDQELYIEYNKGSYYNFGEITTRLYQDFDLCVYGFDKDDNGVSHVWLVTKQYMNRYSK